MDKKKPWDVDERLEEGALTFLARLRLRIRNELAKEQKVEQGDGSYGLGCSTFERFRYQIFKLYRSQAYPWLDVIQIGGGFALAVNGCPIRIYRGDSEDPPTRHLESAIEQLKLFEVAHAGGFAWFMVDETDVRGRGLQVVVMQANDAGEVRHRWLAARASDLISESGSGSTTPLIQVTNSPAPSVEPLSDADIEKDEK